MRLDQDKLVFMARKKSDGDQNEGGEKGLNLMFVVILLVLAVVALAYCASQMS